MKRSASKPSAAARNTPSTAAASRTNAAERAPARRTWQLALAGSALMFAALPPLDLWPLAWVAPVPWLLLCRQPQLDGRRPYLVLWLAGFLFWMAALHWIRLPHPANYLGWVALAAYLAFYIPVFVGLTRVAVQAWKCPLILAAPVVWTGLELARGHLLTGFTMASLGHTQYRWIELIQISDLTGGYGVSFVVMCGAAGIAQMLPWDQQRRAWWPAAAIALLGGVVLGYGYWRLAVPEGKPGPRIALIQGSTDTEIKSDPTKNQLVFQEYFDLSVEAVKRAPALDLLIWPETMFRDPLIEYDPQTVRPPPGAQWDVERLADVADFTRTFIGDTGRGLGVPLLLGVDVHRYGPGTVESFNSAVAVSPTGEIGARYDKMHPVMFGEYIPFAKQFPILYRLLPIKSSITAGERDVVFRAGASRLSANICFETVIPHLIRGQVARLRASGEEPDVLVNLTNDGWFWGSSELDMHLVCGVFRAVENRKPLLIAANTGFSAQIDSSGRIQQQGPRRAREVLIADVRLDGRQSPYSRVGDLFAGVCLLACLALGFYAGAQALRRRRLRASGGLPPNA